MPTPLRLRGARRHHLDLDLDLLPGTWTAIVGRSGSGKTSLVHDTLVAEGQRRLASSWSPKARQALGKLGRPPLDRLEGLPAPVAVGRHSETTSPRSTVGTRSGLLAPLRLLWAREATVPSGEALRRSHFSFNQPEGACPDCDGHGTIDEVDPAKLVADPTRSLRQGALVPTLPSGYIVYSQVTPTVLDGLCRDLGFTLDTPWRDLTEAQQGMVLYGAPHRRVPFGKHDLSSRMTWKGITARPREEGFYRGLVPVLRETLARSRNANVLRFVTTRRCPTCEGQRLGPLGRSARWQGRTLPELLADPVRQGLPWLEGAEGGPVAATVRAEVLPRLERMMHLGLGHLALERPMATLSGGEAQRLALASQLGSQLHGQLVALDEPTLGLHPEAHDGLKRVLDGLVAQGHTLVTVEHDPDFVRHADRVVALGPGAGAEGGRIVADGPPGDDPLGPPPTPRTPRAHQGVVWLRGATLNGLKQADLPVRLGTLNVVLGPSGAGKSSLVHGTLLPALEGRDDGGPYRSLDPLPEGMAVVAIDARPLGRTSRSTPATWTGWFDRLRKRFAATPEARARGWGAGRFAFNSAAGRCPTCEGLGVERIPMHLLEDLLRPCPTCEGRRYAPETLEVRLRGLDIAQVLALGPGEALEVFGDDPELAPVLHALCDLGLGHLPLGQPSPTLSRGEGQRIKLATLVARARAQPALLLMDEPDRGLHPDDLARLLRVFDRLVDQGHTLVAISHHRHVWAAADHRVEVRDGCTHDAPSLDWRRRSSTRPARLPFPLPERIRLRDVRTHHLQGFDLSLPHRALVGIVGVSGAGKSSLAIDTLAAEGRRRLAETLPFHARTFLRRLPRPRLASAEGLTPTLHLAADPGHAGSHATLATASGLGPLLRLLWSRAGDLAGRPTDLPAAAFTTAAATGACPACGGRGAQQEATEAGLITHPDAALASGALAGTRTGRYLGEPDGQHLATLQAAWAEAGIGAEALQVPWRGLPAAARRIALHGAGDRTFEVTWRYQRGTRSGEHRFEGPWPGLLAAATAEAHKRARQKAAAEWAAPLAWVPCDACEGTGLQAPARHVQVEGHTLPELLSQGAEGVRSFLDGLARPRARSVADALARELGPRLASLVDLDLARCPLSARMDDLDPSTRQRVRLVQLLGAGLAHLTLVLDEPGTGLSGRHRERLVALLRRLVAQGHTVVMVTHQPDLMRACDHLVELGPGPGAQGGRIVAEGAPSAVARADTSTGRMLRALPPAASPPSTEGELVEVAADGHRWAFRVPRTGTVALVGAGAPAALDALAHAHPSARRVELPRTGMVLEVLGGARALQQAFAAEHALPAKAFNVRSPAGRCPDCKGTGVDRVALDTFSDLRVPCPTCEGTRVRPEVREARWQGHTLHEVLTAPVDRLRALPDPVAPLGDRLAALGLGALVLGRDVATLSTGERQRLALAPCLADPKTVKGQLLALDQPFRGLHGADAPTVAAALARLAAAGARVVAHETRDDLVHLYDHVARAQPATA